MNLYTHLKGVIHMNLKDYLSVTPEIQEAIDAGKPVVALESTILSHGMPYPQNVEFAHKVEEIVRAEWRDLGMPETLWNCRVKEFGPLIVSIDTEGRNLFEENKVVFNERKEKVYEEICKHVSFIK